jgi:PilZ domain
MQELSSERRGATRIDKVFRVLITSDQHGELWHVGRNISETGMFVEMADPLPLRTRVIVRFSAGDGEPAICAMARVQNHYYLQYSDHDGLRALTGVGLRFVRFVAEPGTPAASDRLH